MTKYKALDIARYIINYAISKEHPISNLQLQKIIYYVQAAFLVEFECGAFEEKVMNWTYGPVVEEVYREYRTYGYLAIDKRQDKYNSIIYDNKDCEIKVIEETFDESMIIKEHKDIINKVVESYMSMDAIDLVEKTHKEDPWLKTRQNETIAEKDIRDYYKLYNYKLYNLIE